jgi:hypothetical protein
MRYHYFIAVALATFFCIYSPVAAQQLPSKPDPDKCYVRLISLDEYVYTYEDYLTYTPEEAAHYPHQTLELIVSPEHSQWEATIPEDCESEDPNDCQVLCYRTYQAETIIIYKPINDTLGTPHTVEVEFERLVQKGGLTSFEEIDCTLMSFSEIPLNWDIEDQSALTPQDKGILDEQIVDLLRDNESFRIQIDVYTQSNGQPDELQDIASTRVSSIIEHLKDRFINTDRVVTKAWGGKRPAKVNPQPQEDTNKKKKKRRKKKKAEVEKKVKINIDPQNDYVLFRVLTLEI